MFPILVWVPGLLILRKMIMMTQTSSIAIPVDSRQELVLQLQREDLEPCHLGTIGNQQFSAEQGGTAPARGVEVLVSEQRRSLTNRRAELSADVPCDHPQARSPRAALLQARVEVRASSRLIGNLLGSLTAKVDEEGRFVNANERAKVVRALIELNESGGEGGLYSLKGAKYCLDTYLDEFKVFDFVALSQGGLCNGRAVDDILAEISTRPDDAVRGQAFRLLSNIAEAFNQRVLRHSVHEPLSKIVDLLAAGSVNEQDLCAQLLALTDDHNTISRYLRGLSTDEFKTLLGALSFQKLYAIQGVLQHKGLYLAASRLGFLIEEMDDEFLSRRAPRSLSIEAQNLTVAVLQGNGPAVPDALRRLSLAVEDTFQTWKALPKSSIERMQVLIGASMGLLRDRQHNPDGPLNLHSLCKLDEGMRANLGAAAVVLRSFGLELEPQVHVGAAHR